MKKKPNSKRKLFFLDEDAIKIIEDISKAQGISQSALIEFWAFSFDENLNPHKKLNSIKKQQKEVKNQLQELEKQEENYLQQIQNAEEWRKEKQKRKPEIVQNLTRILLEKRYEDAEQIAKIQGIRLGINPIELLTQAKKNIDKGI
jgi:hypothetical protein